MPAQLKITQIKSASKRRYDQAQTLRALGIKRDAALRRANRYAADPRHDPQDRPPPRCAGRGRGCGGDAMKLQDLHHAAGAVRKTKRRGKGAATGLGGTAGKGHKGQKARSGGRIHRWFEGGQMPLQRRVPKRGFTNLGRVSYQTVSVERLAGLPAGTVVTRERCARENIVKSATQKTKLRATGSWRSPSRCVSTRPARARRKRSKRPAASSSSPRREPDQNRGGIEWHSSIRSRTSSAFRSCVVGSCSRWGCSRSIAWASTCPPRA